MAFIDHDNLTHSHLMGKGRLRKLSNLGQVHSAAGIQTWGDQTPELSSKENGDQLTGLILCLMEQN